MKLLKANDMGGIQLSPTPTRKPAEDELRSDEMLCSWEVFTLTPCHLVTTATLTAAWGAPRSYRKAEEVVHYLSYVWMDSRSWSRHTDSIKRMCARLGLTLCSAQTPSDVFFATHLRPGLEACCTVYSCQHLVRRWTVTAMFTSHIDQTDNRAVPLAHVFLTEIDY